MPSDRVHDHRRLDPEIRDKARDMRRHPTAAEALLWRALRRRQVAGAKFRRQHPLGRYIVDFYCSEARLVVEIDGPQHDHDVEWEYDQGRERFIESRGLTVVRFAESDVRGQLGDVVEEIAEAIRKAPSRDLPRRGRDAC